MQTTRPPFPPPPYTAPQPLRRRLRLLAWLGRDLKPTDIIIAILALLGAFGFVNPIRRISALETRVSGLEESQRFTNYLLCVQIRRNDPAGVPPGCAPVLDSKERPK